MTRLLRLTFQACVTALTVSAASAALASDATSPNTQAPVAQEQDASASLLRQLQGSEVLGIANIPHAQSYLDELLRRIQAAGPQPARPAQIVIRPKLSYNAATTPSGLIIIDLGWLKTIDSEAELIALLAHEYGHLAGDHLGTKNHVGTLTHVGGLIARAIALRNKVDNSLGVSAVQGGWASLLKPNWSRNQEHEADAFALDITQSLGVSFVSGVRAFLDRIRSIEAQAVSNVADTTPENKKDLNQAATNIAKTAGLNQDHPSIEERIDHVQKLAEGRARIRPSGGPDRWLQVKNSAEFKASEEEYLLAARFLDAAFAQRTAETTELFRQLSNRPKPFRTAALQTVWASAQFDPQVRMQLAKEALAMPDASNLAYLLLANLQRDQLQYQESYATAQAGLDRFDSPSRLWPEMLAFQRSLLDRIEAIPPSNQSTDLKMLTIQIRGNMLALRARCALDAEMNDTCGRASMNAEQARRHEAEQNARSEEAARKLTNRVERLFKK